MKMRKWALAFAVIPALLALSGCDGKAYPDVRQAQAQQATGEGRFEMRVVDEFHDSNAYNNKRSIFIITDTKTHKTYLGVEGVGTTALDDERAQKDDDDSAAAASVSASVAVN